MATVKDKARPLSPIEAHHDHGEVPGGGALGAALVKTSADDYDFDWGTPNLISEMVQTWNNAGTTFTAIKMNVTDTASAAASRLLSLQVGGADRLYVNKTGALVSVDGIEATNYLTSNDKIHIRGANPRLILGAADDLIVIWDAANILAQRNGVNAQAFRLYNTFTDAANYERLGFNWAANVLTILNENAGTGVLRNLILRGILQTYDTTVAALPAAAAGNKGQRRHVTDASATTFASTVVGGGANIVPVFSNGTAWIIG
jgi:hypothetical protein